MTEFDPHTANGEADETRVFARPVPRTMRRTAFRYPASRTELRADAREEARLVRGRASFVWRARVLPIGVPLGAAVGVIIWRLRRSARDSVAAALTTTALCYLEARLEWRARRRAYVRRRNADPVRVD